MSESTQRRAALQRQIWQIANFVEKFKDIKFEKEYESIE